MNIYYSGLYPRVWTSRWLHIFPAVTGKEVDDLYCREEDCFPLEDRLKKTFKNIDNETHNTFQHIGIDQLRVCNMRNSGHVLLLK